MHPDLCMIFLSYIYILPIKTYKHTQKIREAINHQIKGVKMVCVNHGILSGLNFKASFQMRSFISSSDNDSCSKSNTNGDEQVGSSLISWRHDRNGWFSASSTSQTSHEKNRSIYLETRKFTFVKISR